MLKKLLVLSVVMFHISVGAMEKAEPVPLVEDNQSKERMLKIVLQDEQNSEKRHEVEIPFRLAKDVGVLRDLAEDSRVLDEGFPLRNITPQIWSLIAGQLERIHAIDSATNCSLSGAIAEDYAHLDSSTLLALLWATDYLEIPILQDIVAQVAGFSALETMKFDDIVSLPDRIGNRIILQTVLKLMGLGFVKDYLPEATSVCCIDDGRVVVGSGDSVLVLSAEGALLAECKRHEALVTSVCINASNQIVSGSHDGTVRVWDMQGNLLITYNGHGPAVLSVNTMNSFRTKKVDYIVAGYADGTVNVRNLEGTVNESQRDDGGGVLSVSPTDEAKIVSLSASGIVRLLHMMETRLPYSSHLNHTQGRAQDTGPIYALSVTRDGKIIALCGDGTVVVFNGNGGNAHAVYTGDKAAILSVALIASGKIWRCGERSARIWDKNLLDRLSRLNDMTFEQAQGLWKFLTQEKSQKDGIRQRSWSEWEDLISDEKIDDEKKEYCIVS